MRELRQRLGCCLWVAEYDLAALRAQYALRGQILRSAACRIGLAALCLLRACR